MIRKPMARCVIATVVVAGIMTLCLVTTKPLTNTSFAKTSCELRIVAWGHAGGGAIEPVEKGKTVPVSMNVGLSCPAGCTVSGGGPWIPGCPVSGATVNISGGGGSKSVTTDSGGAGEATFDLGPSSNPYNFKANYAGDSQHDAASAATEFFIDEKF